MADRFSFTRSDFPQGFLFGAATAAYQIEGSSFGGCGPSHWDTFAATPGNVVNGENGSVACDHYHRWEADLDLMQAAGLDAYRFSMSWSRVLPEGRGTPNPEGLDFYDRLIDGMLARGIRPFATLYHWELPAAISDLGGWRNRDVAGWFADYAEIIMGRVGDRVQATATINEPWCVAWLSHFLGIHAPGTRDIRAAARAMHHVLLAHGRAVQAMRGMGLTNLGLVTNFEYTEPADASPEAAEAAATNDAIYNRWFVEALFKRAYPAQALAGLEPYMPAGWQDDFDVIASPIDWLGVNYYTRHIVGPGTGPWPALADVTGPLPKTDMGWEIYPDGLYNILTWLDTVTPAGLPLYITENGMANAVPTDDAIRIDYLDRHFAAARRAIAEGVPLKGYFVWSLMDNFEWAVGYDKRFGMVHVDYETLARTPKASLHALRAAIARND